MKATKNTASAKGLIWALVVIAGVVTLSQPVAFSAPKADVKADFAASTKLVNINKASLEELQAIRGIGPALAERVVKYREDNGRFEKVEDLVKVRGIGEAKFEKIKDQVSL